MTVGRDRRTTRVVHEANEWGISLLDFTGDAEQECKSELAVAEGIQYAYAVAHPQEENAIFEGEQVKMAEDVSVEELRKMLKNM